MRVSLLTGDCSRSERVPETTRERVSKICVLTHRVNVKRLSWGETRKRQRRGGGINPRLSRGVQRLLEERRLLIRRLRWLTELHPTSLTTSLARGAWARVFGSQVKKSCEFELLLVDDST